MSNRWWNIVLVGVSLIAWLAPGRDAMAADLEVTLYAGGATPAIVPKEVNTTASLSAIAEWAEPGEQPQAEAEWTWTVTAKEFNRESLDDNAPWEAGSCTTSIGNIVPTQGQGGRPDSCTATLTANAPPGYWRITCKATAKYTVGEQSWAADGIVKVKFTSVAVATVVQTAPSPPNGQAAGPAVILKGTSITLRANRTPPPEQGSYPTNQPTWTISQPSGSNLSAPADGQVQETFTPGVVGEYTLTAKCGPNDDGDSFTFHVTEAIITQLTFLVADGSIYTVEKDAGGNYGTPHWKDTSDPPDGDADDAGDQNYPACYLRGSKMKVSTVFTLAPGVPAPPQANVRVRGFGPSAGKDDHGQELGDLDFGAVQPSSSGNGVITVENHACARSFQNKISFYNRMALRWEISLDAGNSWHQAGTTRNQVYATLAEPTAANLYHTVAHVSCLAAKDQSQSQDTIDKIWDHVKGMVVRNWKDEPATGFKYWGPNAEDVDSTQGLITQFDGQCGAWVRFHRDLLKLQGIDAAAVQILPDPATIGVPGLEADSLWVKNWNTEAANPALWTTRPPDGIPGQGGIANPWNKFTDHGLTVVNTDYYDPSYGLGPYDTLVAWQRAALDAVTFKLDGAIVGSRNTGETWPLRVKTGQSD